MNKNIILSAALAGLFSGSMALAETGTATPTENKDKKAAPAKTEKTEKAAAKKGDEPGKCMGMNACKGQGDCHGKDNTCKGQNTCKGHGWKAMNHSDCTKAKGEFKS